MNWSSVATNLPKFCTFVSVITSNFNESNTDELIMNETVAICRSAGAPALSGIQVERRMRPLLSVLSRTHEYDERFTPETQQWTDSEEELTTKWTFAASSLYALTVITSTGRTFDCR